MRMKRSIKIVLLVLPAIVTLLLAFFSDPKLVLFPSSDFELIVYSDKDAKRGDGATEITGYSVSDSLMEFSFILREGAEYPYAGVTLQLKDEAQFDLTKYDYFEITHRSGSASHIKVQLNSKLENFDKKRYRIYEQPTDSAFTTSIKSIWEIETPSWWYSNTRITPEEIMDENDLQRALSLSIENSDYSELNTPYDISIQSLVFKKSLFPYYVFAGLWISIAGLLLIKSKISGKVVNLPSHKPVVLSDPNEELFSQIKTYVDEHYSNPEFSLEIAAKELSISRGKFAPLFRSKENCTFKQYVNSIRLKEAYRLLQESDVQVAQILFAVGFNSPSNFNRLFYQKYRISPTEVRKMK